MLSGKLKEEVHCPGCQQIFQNPLLLPCGHSVCVACANRLWFPMTWPGKQYPVLSADDAVSEADSGVVVCSTESTGSLNHTTTTTISTISPRECCPSCSTIPKLPAENLIERYPTAQDWWPRNVALENLIYRLSELNSNGSKELVNRPQPNAFRQCHLCESKPAGVPAVSYCENCHLAYCSRCVTKWHPNSGLLSRHRIASVTEQGLSSTSSIHNISQSETVQCSDHPDRSCRLYCLDCNLLVCTQCLQDPVESRAPFQSNCCLDKTIVLTPMTNGYSTQQVQCWASTNGSASFGLTKSSHSGHVICSATVQAKRCKTEVTKHLHKLSALAKEGGELVQELKSTGTRIMQSAQNMESNVNKQIDLLIQLLERRRAILLDELRSQLQHRGRRLREQSNQVGSRLSATTSLIHFAVELLKEQDAAAFIQILPSIQKRILTAESQFEMELELANQTKACGEIELRVNTDLIGQQVETLQLEEYYAPPVPAFLSSECVVDGNALFVVWHSPRLCPNRNESVAQIPQETPSQTRCPFADAVDTSLGGSRPSGLAQFSCRPGLHPIKQNGHLNATPFHPNRLSPQQFPVSVSAYHLSDKAFDGPLSNGGHTAATPYGSRKTLAPFGTRQPEMNSSQSMNAIHPPSQVVGNVQITAGRLSPRSPGECNPITYFLEVDNGRGGIFKVAYTGPETACRLEGLQFNTTYRLRVRARNSVGHSAYSDPIHLKTARLATFRIDPSSGLPHSNGLRVDPDGVTVQSLGDVEDRVLLADVGFSQGTHYWEWRIDSYDGRGQPSFGVALNSVARDRMLGLDNAGWAMYANSNRSWFVHAGQHRDRTDGGILTKDQLERDHQPTVIGVRLDCDQGHLGFYLNGEPHGPVAFTNLLQNGKQSTEVLETDLKDGVHVARTVKPSLFYPALSLSHFTRVKLITGLEVPSESEESSEESEVECGVLAVHTPESASSLSTPNNTSERSRTSVSTGKDSSSSTTSTDGGSQLRPNRPSAIHPDMTGIGLTRGCTILTGSVGVTGPKSPTPIRLVTFGRS